MARAPFQVLVLPYRRREAGAIEYAVFRRADLGVWQGIAGGGEDHETPEAAAVREAFEEAAIAPTRSFERLASTGAIALEHFTDGAGWGPGLRTIPEYSFAVDVGDKPLRLSAEHSAVRWVGFHEAVASLEWESNRIALRELNERLTARASGSGAHAV